MNNEDEVVKYGTLAITFVGIDILLIMHLLTLLQTV